MVLVLFNLCPPGYYLSNLIIKSMMRLFSGLKLDFLVNLGDRGVEPGQGWRAWWKPGHIGTIVLINIWETTPLITY